jgi:hypothetical protein
VTGSEKRKETLFEVIFGLIYTFMNINILFLNCVDPRKFVATIYKMHWRCKLKRNIKLKSNSESQRTSSIVCEIWNLYSDWIQWTPSRTVYRKPAHTDMSAWQLPSSSFTKICCFFPHLPEELRSFVVLKASVVKTFSQNDCSAEHIQWTLNLEQRMHPQWDNLAGVPHWQVQQAGGEI